MSKQPLVSMILMSYNQAQFIRESVEGALNQTYDNLEIIISDDHSSDHTFSIIEQVTQSYIGPHHIRVHRNNKNLGISGNLAQAISLSRGELIFITAGDDISVPTRVETVTGKWMEQQQKPDLIASYLFDIDEQGGEHGIISVADLSTYKCIDDWAFNPPKIIGAGQAWTRRLFDHFGGIPSGIVAEDMVMTFRAISCGGATTIPLPLVRYRRGGTTSKRRHFHAQEVINAFVKKIQNTKTELACMLNDAREKNASAKTLDYLQNLYDKEVFIEQMLCSNSSASKKTFTALIARQPALFKLRIFVYGLTPWLLSPFFWIKRLVRK